MKALSMKSVALLALSLGLSTAYAADVNADKEAVNAACSQDAATAGCGSETVGKGLLKCLHTYKKEHKDFKFSEGCKSAMKTLHADKKEMKKIIKKKGDPKAQQSDGHEGRQKAPPKEGSANSNHSTGESKLKSEQPPQKQKTPEVSLEGFPKTTST